MTPQQFAGAYLHTAQLVTAGTGIDAFVLLAQWANETDWGNVVVGNNLGNIRCSPTTFCRYATLDDFAAACVATFHNGYYGAVLAAVGPAAQLAAIVASPWDAGHYGGSLQAFYSPLKGAETMPPGMKIALANIAFNAIYRRPPTQQEEFDFANTLLDDGSNFNTLVDGLNANSHNADIAPLQPDVLRADVNKALAQGSVPGTVPQHTHEVAAKTGTADALGVV